MQKISDSKKRETQMNPAVRLADRKCVLERLKFGICPECGYDTRRKYNQADQFVMTYCTNTSCKCYEEAYRDVYKWLIHHGGV